MKVDFYTEIHKALRRWLFNISMGLATRDGDDTARGHALYQDILQCIKLLRAHAKHEEEFFHPLILKKLDSVEIKLSHDHQLQEKWLEELEESGRTILTMPAGENAKEALAFYRDFNRFIANYLLHMEEEESIMPILQEQCTKEELEAAIFALLSSLTDQEFLDSIVYMFPALNPEERLAMMQGLLRGCSSGEMLNKIRSTAESVLSPEAWQALNKNL